MLGVALPLCSASEDRREEENVLSDAGLDSTLTASEYGVPRDSGNSGGVPDSEEVHGIDQ